MSQKNSHMQHSKETLIVVVEQVATGDRNAFEELYRATSQKLFGIVLRILKQQELAEEILQEVYLKVWDKAADFDGTRASPITWMATIARNRALDELRKHPLPTADSNEDVELVADTAKTPETTFEVNQELQRLENCLDGLDSPRAEMIKSAYLEGYSRQELATLFNQPLGTIKTWLHRSIKQLQDCMSI